MVERRSAPLPPGGNRQSAKRPPPRGRSTPKEALPPHGLAGARELKAAGRLDRQDGDVPKLPPWPQTRLALLIAVITGLLAGVAVAAIGLPDFWESAVQGAASGAMFVIVLSRLLARQALKGPHGEGESAETSEGAQEAR